MNSEMDDPWATISPPGKTTALNAKRIDVKLRWNYFWAVDTRNDYLMVVQHSKDNVPQGRLPKLNGLQVEVLSETESNHVHLVIRLEDKAHRSLFRRLCQSLVEAGEKAESEPEVITAVLNGIWRWHRLLRKGAEDRLSLEDQKGLIGELVFLQRHLLPFIGAQDAVTAWMGPLDHPKDFEIGGVCIEAKAHRPGTKVRISSESQLEAGEAEHLFLHVTEVSVANESISEAITVTTMAERVRDAILQQDTAAADLLEARLAGAGFEWDTDYTDNYWLVGSEHLFSVKADFPKIVPEMLPPGVDRVRYSLALVHCEAFRAEFEVLTRLIERGHNGNNN